MNAISTIFMKELKDTLRDRRTIITMIVVPVILIPVLLGIVSNLATKQIKGVLHFYYPKITNKSVELRIQMQNGIKVQSRIFHNFYILVMRELLIKCNSMNKKTGKKSKKNVPKKIYITWVNIVDSYS